MELKKIDQADYVREGSGHGVGQVDVGRVGSDLAKRLQTDITATVREVIEHANEHHDALIFQGNDMYHKYPPYGGLNKIIKERGTDTTVRTLIGLLIQQELDSLVDDESSPVVRDPSNNFRIK